MDVPATFDLDRVTTILARCCATPELWRTAHAKGEFFCQAREQGFRTYLYYVATEDPEINVSRVAYRVSLGKISQSEEPNV
jgi:hypothetical protein